MADAILVRFVCGHPARSLGSDADISSVVCEVCNERRVRSVTAPPPRIRAVGCQGAEMGPLVTHA